MEENCWKDRIRELLIDYMRRYREEKHLQTLWRTPLVGFAGANDPYVRNLPDIVAAEHKLPEDFMEKPTVVICYFIPFTKELAKTNVGVKNNLASKEWADAYRITNTLMANMNEFLVTEIEKAGGRAAVPKGVGMLADILKSSWSQRHLAFAAGLGTFGLNNMLITEEGCCGRYNSIVADIPAEPGHHLEQENCLYKFGGICGKCVKNCFSGALTTDGFDRHKCYNACMRNDVELGQDVCGKCDTDIPCAFINPRKLL